MTAVLELGALLGALAAGVLADRYSRRHTILLASVIFVIGSAIQTLSQSIPHLITGRAIGGIGVGALSMLSPLYMAEISPPEVRGSLIALEQLAIVSGVVFGFWFGFGTRNMDGSISWRLPLGIQLIPGIILGLGCLFLPPSPRLLVLQGKLEDAKKSLAYLRQRDADDPVLREELLSMRLEALLLSRTSSETPAKSTSIVSAWSVLFSKKYLRRTMIGVGMMFFQQWSAINALLYYGPTLVESIGLGAPTSGSGPSTSMPADEGGDKAGSPTNLLVSGGIGIVQLVAVLPAIVFIDRLGRRALLRGGSVVMGCAHFAIAFLIYQFSSDWEHHQAGAWAAVVCIYIFTLAYGLSFGPVGWVLPSEVFPLEVRSKGVALSTASNWTNNFIIGLITPPLMAYSPAITFITFSTTCFLAYLWASRCVPETAGRSLEEIGRLFGDGGGVLYHGVDSSQFGPIEVRGEERDGLLHRGSGGRRDMRSMIEAELRAEMGLDGA